MTHTSRQSLLPALLLIALITGAAENAHARTIELQVEAMDKAAMIHARAPHASWAGRHVWGHTMLAAAYIEPESALLMRYDISEVPEDMRVTKAEWFIPVYRREPRQVRLSVWRMLTAWDIGVCYDYRMTEPEEKAWDAPGGRSPGVDRAVQPSRVVEIEDNETMIVINVTQDVSLWHRGLVANDGWMLTVDDSNAHAYLHSPLTPGGDQWKLRITYEPQ